MRGVFINDLDARQGVRQGRHSFIGLRPGGAVAALEFFVKQTNGGLETLELYRANVAPDRLLGCAARVRASRSCGRRCMR